MKNIIGNKIIALMQFSIVKNFISLQPICVKQSNEHNEQKH